MYVAILLLCVIVPAQSASFQYFDDDDKAGSNYIGCMREDAICKKRVPANCSIPNIVYQCPRMCGACLPFTPKCPQVYPYGCCWNGDQAIDIQKSNCKKCKDMNPKYCQLEGVKKDCDFSRQTITTRAICPETCNACHDYGFVPCGDSDERCAKMEDTTCCESSEILQDICKKTCGICA